METREEKMLVAPISSVRIDEAQNCRGVIPLSDLTLLAEDIEKNGQLVPVLCRYRYASEDFPEDYVVVAGFSRAKSIRDVLKRDEIKTVVRDLTPQQCAVINAAENLKRRDLNIMQEAQAIYNLVRMGLDRSAICKELGMTVGWVQPRLYLLQLPEEVQKMAAAGYITTENIRNLYSIKDVAEQISIARRIKQAKQKDRVSKVEVRVFSNTSDTRKSKARIARHRTRQEIENMQDWLESIKFPPGLHLGFLAWAGGHIDDMEIQTRIQTFLMETGRYDFFPSDKGIPNMKEETRIL